MMVEYGRMMDERWVSSDNGGIKESGDIYTAENVSIWDITG
jgi:hypothetical protein